MGTIQLKTELPGPKSRAMLARRAAAVAAGLAKSTDIAVERAEGARVYDVDGNTLLDFAGGIGMLAVGHSPPDVVSAMAGQSQRASGGHHTNRQRSRRSRYSGGARAARAATPAGTRAVRAHWQSAGSPFALRARLHFGGPAASCVADGRRCSNAWHPATQPL